MSILFARNHSRRLHRITTAGLRRLTLGIRREDPSRIWERRAPLTPDAVHRLVSQSGLAVHVQSCYRRVFPDTDYEKAGAVITRDLANAHIVLGIKEPPLSEVETAPIDGTFSRVHLMFSHTAKGQPYNTPLLARFVAKGGQGDTYCPQLIDYELLTNESGRRTVGFGWFAGVAGTLESLSSMSQSHLQMGIASPFLYTPRPHSMPSLDKLRRALHDLGDQIASEGTPPVLGPMVIGLTGTGQVAQGCLDTLKELPLGPVSVSDLPSLVRNPGNISATEVYICHAKPQDYFVREGNSAYTRDDYYANPHLYRSVFSEKVVAPYLTLFLHGAGWAPGYPRLMRNEDLTAALTLASQLQGARGINIGDISCDIEGGLQFLHSPSTLSDPFYRTRPASLPAHLPDVQIMAIDILPTALPLDASRHFSSVLMPYVERLVNMYPDECLIGDDYAVALDRATIASGGRLREPYRWLQTAVDAFEGEPPRPSSQSGIAAAPSKLGSSQKKHILMLGSGMVAGPAVVEIAKRSDIQLVIASNVLTELKGLVKDKMNVEYRLVDGSATVDGPGGAVDQLVQHADVVISLLPAPLHPRVAEMCIRHRTHLVTASYISPEMSVLHDRAVNADVLLFNEIGLDPGIDHCSALSLIDKLKSEGKTIHSFTSFCGGLPAPDVPVVPLRYKFSWSPRGALTAVSKNAARYRLGGKEHSVPAGRALMGAHINNIPVADQFELEGFPNRNSLVYIDQYGLPHARTVLRGTLRYPGFCDLMSAFISLGFLRHSNTVQLKDWSSFVAQAYSAVLHYAVDHDGTLAHLANELPSHQMDALVDALEWLSLVPGCVQNDMPTVPSSPMTPLDLFAYLLAYKLRYLPGERDMVVLSHEIVASATPASPTEIHRSSLVAYADDQGTAMARTVGLPIAFAALRILDGQVPYRGVQGPTHPAVYNAILADLERVGLGMVETVSRSANALGYVEMAAAIHT
ncbi:hypothetical protein FISHEDRAFT_44841 [Fistulina hepatica ATCC 64428]|uniref:Alanine dehydrogenase/pyridine nucleotide transhydrogenase N-terminal domain-containing protein n=1 Tax=Fistulina hepatica ATCC 64428 TaxID=1128425 RepID=A0A0D7A9M9_9AGAR|nr:hypothetical protein FISHEDRAFT_44841 [Fistulina hepatica ATCC 64428]